MIVTRLGYTAVWTAIAYLMLPFAGPASVSAIAVLILAFSISFQYLMIRPVLQDESSARWVLGWIIGSMGVGAALSICGWLLLGTYAWDPTLSTEELTRAYMLRTMPTIIGGALFIAGVCEKDERLNKTSR